MTEEKLSEKEIAARRDAALKRALSMPPKPFTSPSKPKARKVKRRGQAKRK